MSRRRDLADTLQWGGDMVQVPTCESLHPVWGGNAVSIIRAWLMHVFGAAAAVDTEYHGDCS